MILNIISADNFSVDTPDLFLEETGTPNVKICINTESEMLFLLYFQFNFLCLLSYVNIMKFEDLIQYPKSDFETRNSKFDIRNSKFEIFLRSRCVRRLSVTQFEKHYWVLLEVMQLCFLYYYYLPFT